MKVHEYKNTPINIVIPINIFHCNPIGHNIRNNFAKQFKIIKKLPTVSLQL